MSLFNVSIAEIGNLASATSASETEPASDIEAGHASDQRPLFYQYLAVTSIDFGATTALSMPEKMFTAVFLADAVVYVAAAPGLGLYTAAVSDQALSSLVFTDFG